MPKYIMAIPLTQNVWKKYWGDAKLIWHLLVLHIGMMSIILMMNYKAMFVLLVHQNGIADFFAKWSRMSVLTCQKMVTLFFLSMRKSI